MIYICYRKYDGRQYIGLVDAQSDKNAQVKFADKFNDFKETWDFEYYNDTNKDLASHLKEVKTKKEKDKIKKEILEFHNITMQEKESERESILSEIEVSVIDGEPIVLKTGYHFEV